ncbi:MAG: hypothetical protein LBL53_00995, partial [Endomicrobium sp.]|nr:hypothetical protein [Endomicrobium sp.]
MLKNKITILLSVFLYILYSIGQNSVVFAANGDKNANKKAIVTENRLALPFNEENVGPFSIQHLSRELDKEQIKYLNEHKGVFFEKESKKKKSMMKTVVVPVVASCVFTGVAKLYDNVSKLKPNKSNKPRKPRKPRKPKRFLLFPLNRSGKALLYRDEVNFLKYIEEAKVKLGKNIKAVIKKIKKQFNRLVRDRKKTKRHNSKKLKRIVIVNDDNIEYEFAEVAMNNLEAREERE